MSPKKDEEFLSNSIVQWNQKMKLRQRTLNLEDEEIHDEHNLKIHRTTKSLENLDQLEDQQQNSPKRR